MIPSPIARGDRINLWLWALIALATGTLVITRASSGLGSFELLLLAGVIAFAAGSATAWIPRNGSQQPTLAVGLMAFAGAVRLCALGLGIENSGVRAAAVLALTGAMAIALTPDRLWLLIPASCLAVPLLVLASFGNASMTPSHIEQIVAAISATFAIACAIDRFDRMAVDRIPSGIVFAVAAIALARSACTTESLWLTVPIALVGAALVLDSFMARDSTYPANFSAQPDLPLAIAGSLAITTGSAGIAILLALGEGTGWSITGSISAGLLGLAVLEGKLGSSQRERSDRLLRIARESRLDGLTGLLNRRGIDERLAEEVARATRYGHELSVLMIDLDDFKAINDRFGHAAGDQALRSTAHEIAESIRSIDVAGRYGGEEFLVLLPETGAAGALVVAERIRSAVEGGGQTTVSLGAATRALENETTVELVERADTALYVAKRSGKNQTVLAG